MCLWSFPHIKCLPFWKFINVYEENWERENSLFSFVLITTQKIEKEKTDSFSVGFENNGCTVDEHHHHHHRIENHIWIWWFNHILSSNRRCRSSNNIKFVFDDDWYTWNTQMNWEWLVCTPNDTDVLLHVSYINCLFNVFQYTRVHSNAFLLHFLILFLSLSLSFNFEASIISRMQFSDTVHWFTQRKYKHWP